MAKVQGIQFEKDSHGHVAYVRINLKKYRKEIEPFLTSIGAIEEDEFDKEFEEGCKNGITGEQLLADVLPRIKKLFSVCL